MLIRRAAGRYKETKFYRVGKGVGFVHSTGCISRRATSWEREGVILLSRFRRSEAKGIAQSVLETPESPGTSEETIPEGQAGVAKAAGRR